MFVINIMSKNKLISHVRIRYTVSVQRILGPFFMNDEKGKLRVATERDDHPYRSRISSYATVKVSKTNNSVWYWLPLPVPLFRSYTTWTLLRRMLKERVFNCKDSSRTVRELSIFVKGYVWKSALTVWRMSTERWCKFTSHISW